MGKKVSFVIPTVNEGDNLFATIQSLRDTTEVDYEIIVVDNGSTDGSTDFIEQEGDPRNRLFRSEHRLGVAGARNFGAAFAEGDFLIFVDAHVLFPYNWIAPILENLGGQGVGMVVPTVSAWGSPESRGYGMSWTNERLDVEWLGLQSTDPYAVPLAAGLFQACRWDFFHEIGGFDPGMKGYGHEDLEFCLRIWLLGYQVMIVPEVEISHLFRDSATYSVKWIDVMYNLLRTIYAHFNTERIGRIILQFQSDPPFNDALKRMNFSDIWSRRRTLELKRKYDDDWFFSTFGINC